jgi:hypothetical protein
MQNGGGGESLSGRKALSPPHLPQQTGLGDAGHNVAEQ